MLKILAIAAVLLMFPVTATERSLESATANESMDVVCETIAVTCPERVDQHSNINFEASVARAAGPLLPLQYRWSLRGVPRARIKSGRGTPSIVVSVPRRVVGRLTATVTVIGVVKGCNNQASCRTTITRRQ
jgi:hypothetical protein